MALKSDLIVLAMASAGMLVMGQAHATGAAPGVVAARSSGQSTVPPVAGTSTGKPDNRKASNKKKKRSQKKQLQATLGTITVTGFSRSVETSIDYQRYSDKIENVVTATEVNGLPDQSIADALTRLPGVATQRISGQASQINIRGLTGNFILTTLNGRAQPSSSGSNYTEFDLYPSELIHQVAVYKSSQADLLEGGVGGTIAMQTADPLLSPRQQSFNLDVRGSYNSRTGQVYGANPRGFRISGAWQGKFLDNTLGIGLGFAEMYQPHVAEQFVNESYSQTPETIDGKSTIVNTGIQLGQDGGTDRRRGYMATIVWQPNHHLKVSANGFFSKFNDGSFQRGILGQEFTNGLSVITNPLTTPQGALVGATVGSLPGGFFGIPGLQDFSASAMDNNQSTDSSVFSGGVNVLWHSEPWTLSLDLSSAHATSYSVGSAVYADPYNGLDTGQPRIALQSLTFGLHGLHVGDFSLSNPAMYTDLGKMALSDYGIFPTLYHDRMKALHFRATYAPDGSSIFSALEAGVYARNHAYNAERSVWLYGAAAGQYWLSTPDQPPLTLTSADATTQCWKGRLFGGFPCFLAINGPAVLAAHGIDPNPVKDWSQNWTETQSGDVNVKVRDAFLQADIDASLFGRELTGNVGVRVGPAGCLQRPDGLLRTGNGVRFPGRVSIHESLARRGAGAEPDRPADALVFR